MEIQVGEYVRTDKGIIYKFEEHMNNVEEKDFILCNWGRNVKHSKNIIDLIEVGDYVNRKCCIDIEYNETDDGRRNLNLVCLGGSILELNNNIKSIVTHEQFSKVEYEV